METGEEVIRRLVKTIMDAEKALHEFLDSSPPIEDIAQSLVDLNEVKGQVSDMYGFYSSKVLSILQSAEISDMEVGKARIEIKSAGDRKKWVHEDLANAVTKRLIDMSVDMDTGEVLLSPAEIAKKMLDFVQPSYWRVKELAKIGINADQYCEVGEYKQNIIVRREKL